MTEKTKKKHRKDTKKKKPVYHQWGGTREGSGRPKYERRIKTASYYFFEDQLNAVKKISVIKEMKQVDVVRDIMDKWLNLGEYKVVDKKRGK